MQSLYANGWVVTMDDAATEHPHGWVLVEEGVIVSIGGGAEPAGRDDLERIDLGGAVVTPGLVNTHHHLCQTLTRARAQQADLFTWLRELYPVWARLDAEAEYAAAIREMAAGCDALEALPPGELARLDLGPDAFGGHRTPGQLPEQPEPGLLVRSTLCAVEPGAGQ